MYVAIKSLLLLLLLNTVYVIIPPHDPFPTFFREERVYILQRTGKSLEVERFIKRNYSSDPIKKLLFYRRIPLTCSQEAVQHRETGYFTISIERGKGLLYRLRGERGDKTITEGKLGETKIVFKKGRSRYII